MLAFPVAECELPKSDAPCMFPMPFWVAFVLSRCFNPFSLKLLSPLWIIRKPLLRMLRNVRPTFHEIKIFWGIVMWIPIFVVYMVSFRYFFEPI